MTTLERDDAEIVTMTVERLVPGGLGLARDGGRTVLLAGTAPGDVVEVMTGAGGRVQSHRVVQASADRVEPVCVDVERCGGCDLMHLGYPTQLAQKRGTLEDCLRRIGRLRAWPEIAVVGSPAETGYRWRAGLHVAADGTLGYKSRRSNEVVEIRRCHVLHPTLEAWRAGFDASALPAGSRVSGMTDGEGMSVDRPGGGAAAVLTMTVGRGTYLAAADGFFQGNGALAGRLVEEVLGQAAVHGDDKVLDLYAGVGLFSLPLAERAGRVTAVESDARAAGLLRRRAAAAGIDNLTLREERVEQTLRRRDSGRRPTVVVLDPPRAGAGGEVVMRIAGVRPRRVVMVSCDPATFARDVRTFGEAGYALDAVTMLDMFPQTHHLEVVASLVATAGEGAEGE